MFRKLRNQFILTTMSIVSIVLIISFSAIYISSANTFYRDLEPPRSGPGTARPERFDDETRQYITEQRQALAKRSLGELLITLIGCGLVTLVAVYFVSRFIAYRAVSVIEQAYTKQRQFIADASHELKTPIAVISTNAEAALSDEKDTAKWLNTISNEAQRMGGLVTNLLELVHLDTAPGTQAHAAFDVSAVVRDTEEKFLPVAMKKKVALTSHIGKGLRATSDKEKVAQLLTILVDNAIKYTEPKGTVTLTVRAEHGRIIVSVTNTHEAVQPEELERFFERFYQADSSHHTDGHGLGLAIAKGISQQLESDLHAASDEQAVTFYFDLPASSPILET